MGMGMDCEGVPRSLYVVCDGGGNKNPLSVVMVGSDVGCLMPADYLVPPPVASDSHWIGNL